MPEGTHGMSLNERPGIYKILDPKMLTHEDATNDMPNESPLDGDMPGGQARTPAARDRSHLTWREVSLSKRTLLIAARTAIAGA